MSDPSSEELASLRKENATLKIQVEQLKMFMGKLQEKIQENEAKWKEQAGTLMKELLQAKMEVSKLRHEATSKVATTPISESDETTTRTTTTASRTPTLTVSASDSSLPPSATAVAADTTTTTTTPTISTTITATTITTTTPTPSTPPPKTCPPVLLKLPVAIHRLQLSQDDFDNHLRELPIVEGTAHDTPVRHIEDKTPREQDANDGGATLLVEKDFLLHPEDTVDVGASVDVRMNGVVSGHNDNKNKNNKDHSAGDETTIDKRTSTASTLMAAASVARRSVSPRGDSITSPREGACEADGKKKDKKMTDEQLLMAMMGGTVRNEEQSVVVVVERPKSEENRGDEGGKYMQMLSRRPKRHSNQ